MYEGRTARGRVTHTLSRGRLVWADEQLVCVPGTGRFVPTPPFAPTLFGGMAERDAAAAQARRVPRGSVAARDEVYAQPLPPAPPSLQRHDEL